MCINHVYYNLVGGFKPLENSSQNEIKEHEDTT